MTFYWNRPGGSFWESRRIFCYPPCSGIRSGPQHGQEMGNDGGQDEKQQHRLRYSLSTPAAAAIAVAFMSVLLLLPLATTAESTHYKGKQHFPRAFVQVPQEEGGNGYQLVNLHRISYVNSDGDLVWVYNDPHGMDYNPDWDDQTSLGLGTQISFMVPQPASNNLKQVEGAEIRIQGPGNDDDFSYGSWQTGLIYRQGPAYEFNGYARVSFMLEKPESMSEEDWTAGPSGKDGMLVWLTLNFTDGTKMRYLLIAGISGTCGPEYVEDDGGRSCIMAVSSSS